MTGREGCGADDRRRTPSSPAGFHQGTASLRKDGEYRILTDEGRQLYEDNRHRLD